MEPIKCSVQHVHSACSELIWQNYNFLICLQKIQWKVMEGSVFAIKREIRLNCNNLSQVMCTQWNIAHEYLSREHITHNMSIWTNWWTCWTACEEQHLKLLLTIIIGDNPSSRYRAPLKCKLEKYPNGKNVNLTVSTVIGKRNLTFFQVLNNCVVLSTQFKLKWLK